MSTDEEWAPYSAWNLEEAELLPKAWLNDVLRVVSQHEQKTILDGRSITSREPSGGVSIEVGVVSGNAIQRHLPWLFALYANELRVFASRVAGAEVYISNDLASSININVLRGECARYEWHVDSNPLTGLLFVTSHPAGSGGELLFEKPPFRCVVRPVAGTFIAFDARAIPHTVMPLEDDGLRMSVPMNYYLSPTDQSRPADLDGYLYTGAA